MSAPVTPLPGLFRADIDMVTGDASNQELDLVPKCCQGDYASRIRDMTKTHTSPRYTFSQGKDSDDALIKLTY